LEGPGRLDPPRRLDRPFQKTYPQVNPQLPSSDLPNHSTDCSETSGIVGLPPIQPLPQRNRPESFRIKSNRRNCLSRTRTRPTRKTTKSSPIQGRFGGKVTGQRGTRSSYVTPNKIPKKSFSKLHQEITTKSSENHHKEGREKHFTTLRNHAESSIHTMKVHTRSSIPPIHPSLSRSHMNLSS
jgi:hypothetical protein